MMNLKDIRNDYFNMYNNGSNDDFMTDAYLRALVVLDKVLKENLDEKYILSSIDLYEEEKDMQYSDRSKLVYTHTAILLRKTINKTWL